MSKGRMVGVIGIALLLLIAGFQTVPRVSAAASAPIVLPFRTSWENSPSLEPQGATNTIDHKSPYFYGYYGPGNPLQPELGWRSSGDMNVVTPPNGAFYGYNFGSRYLMAAGYFGSSTSYCYFDLFDKNLNIDYGSPFRLREHTFINIWYYHYQLRDCMIDGQLYNTRTMQWVTLSNFYYNGGYIVDQNNRRLHPAHRSNDAIGSWQYASFDLSLIWTSDPGNWWVTEIWIGFDNSIDHAMGSARTYFDMLSIEYGDTQYTTQTQNGGGCPYPACTSASIFVVGYGSFQGQYQLYLKLGLTGQRYYYVSTWAYPNKLRVSQSNVNIQELLPPTGVNISDTNPSYPKGSVSTFGMTFASMLIELVPGFEAIPVLMLAFEFCGLISPPQQPAVYQWPDSLTWDVEPAGVVGPHKALGEVYVSTQLLPPGSSTISMTFAVTYYKGPVWTPVDSASLTVSVDWTSYPDPDLVPDYPPHKPSTPSGRTSGLTGNLYSYSTSTTDDDDNEVAYQFDWGDGSTTTTGYYLKGTTVSASHRWGEPNSYYVKVRAKDPHGQWSVWSNSLKVTIVQKRTGPY